MGNPNAGQVSVVKAMDEECRGCPEDCKQFVWQVSIGGVVIVDAISAYGVMAFFDDYIPQFEAGIKEFEAGIKEAQEMVGSMKLLRAEISRQVDEEEARDNQPPTLGFN